MLEEMLGGRKLTTLRRLHHETGKDGCVLNRTDTTAYAAAAAQKNGTVYCVKEPRLG